jgi:putative drug exporter of the RND superfamily
VTGPAGYFRRLQRVFSGLTLGCVITAAIVIVIVLVTYRSPVLWLLPLAGVLVA